MFGEIHNTHGEKIDYSFHPVEGVSDKLVVLGHGVTGNKDRPFVVALAGALAAAGLPALRFSFSGNGASGGRFEDSTISREVDDLGAVLDRLGSPKIAYVGHSMGGAVGVLRTARDSRIKALVSLAGMVYTEDFYKREFGLLEPGKGFMWDEPSCPLSQTYVDDMKRIGNVLAQAPAIKVPWLLVHGTEDDVVPPKDSEDIFARANQPKELVLVPGANHVFSGEACEKMCALVVGWLSRNL